MTRYVRLDGGLCNQVFGFVWAVLDAMECGHTAVIDDIVSCFLTRQTCPADEVLDLTVFGCQARARQARDAGKHFVERAGGVWPTMSTRHRFDEVLQKVRFHPRFHARAAAALAGVRGRHLNVIHVRTEQDAMRHYAPRIGVHPDRFYDILVQRYKAIIDLHLRPAADTTTLVLTYDAHDNPVIQHLHSAGHDVVVIPKEGGQRELSAIVDLLAGERCTGLFIGNMGSSFTYALCCRMADHVPKVLVDLDDIFGEPTVMPAGGPYPKLPA